MVFKWLKQPVVLGYIVAGIIAGPAVPYIPTVSDPANIKIWADIGVIFLLFAMGLEFSFKKLMTVGGTAVIASITIVSGMMFLGYAAGNALGFSHISSIFLGGMLSMSSTAIVFKAFDDMGLRGQKFTGVVLGVLVVEDLVAVVLMVLLSTLAVSQQVEGMEMLKSILKLGAFLIFWSLLGIYLIPSFLKKVKPFLNDETLLIIALGFCLGMVMIATKAGFSSALGAFVMGSLLAETIEAEKIEKLVKPVKDLFAAIFFVSVGMMIQPDLLIEYLIPICILTILVIVGQVFFGSLGILLSGQSLKIALQSGFSLTQVGEFAFIIASLGVSLKVTDDYLYPVIVAVSVVTTFLTPYMIRLAIPTYQLIENHLPSSVKLMLNRYSSGSNTVKHKSTWNKLLKSMLLDVILYTVLTIFSIILFFTYINPIIRENISGIKGALLSLSIILAVILPFLWAIIMKKNHSPEFQKLWNDSKYNRGPLVSLIAIKILLCASILMPVIVHILNVASGVGFIVTLLILAMIILSKKLKKRSLIHSDQEVKAVLNKLQAQFKDYQLALYLYSYSTFLEVLLLGNFGKGYLNSVEHRIAEYSFQYRELYTDCYNLMESYSKSSIQVGMLNGLATASKFMGNAIAKVPVISKSQLDENLIEASGKLGLHGEKRATGALERFISTRSNVTQPFIENIRVVNALYNKPVAYLIDGENIYVQQSAGD